MLPISVLAVTYGKTGESTNFNGDVGVPTGKGYYINGVQVTSDALSDVASIGMLDENEAVTGFWNFLEFSVKLESDTPAEYAYVDFLRRRDGDPTYDISSGDIIGSMDFLGWSTGYAIGAQVRSIVDGTPGFGDMPTRLEFLTSADGSGTPTLRIAIDNAGNIKMGDGIWTDYFNVTDSGEVTFVGASSITLPMAIITGLTDVTSVDADYMIIWDSSENALKKVDMGEVRGGGSATAWDDIGNPDAADEIDFAAHVIELNVENFQVGDGGANYVDFADAGVLTLVGTSTICTVDSVEFTYLEGVTEEIQTALDTIIANVVEDSTPELGGELDAGAHSIGFTLQTATGDGTTSVDWKLGNKLQFTHGGMNETFTFDSPTNPCNVQMEIIQDGVGSRDCTWPPVVKWLGTEPTWTDGGANKTIIVSMWYNAAEYWAQGTAWEE